MPRKLKTYSCGNGDVYPSDHEVGVEVPSGGSCCANCRYLGEDTYVCNNPFWQNWSGTDELPVSADRYCCDHWREAE